MIPHGKPRPPTNSEGRMNEIVRRDDRPTDLGQVLDFRMPYLQHGTTFVKNALSERYPGCAVDGE